MSLKDQKRVTVRLKCPNPLFEEWLLSWKEQAAAKGSKMQYSFNHALQSLRKYPLPLESGKDCMILKGFGIKLCNMLDEKLTEHKKTHETVNSNIALPLTGAARKETKSKKQLDGIEEMGNASIKQYIPQFCSGGYAILISLYKQSLQQNYPGFLSKAQIIQHGKDFVNSSFTKPSPGSRYTAWSSMKTLIAKNLVSKCSHPPKYSLTQEGEILAKKLYEESDENNKDKNGNKTLKTNYISEEFVSKDFTKENEGSNKIIKDNFKSYDVDIPDEFTDELFRNTCITENETFSVNTNNGNIIYDTAVDIRNDQEKNYSLFISDARVREDQGEDYKDTLKRIDSVEFVGTSKQSSSKMPCGRFLSRRSVSSQETSYSELISFKQNSKHLFQKYPSTSCISSVKSVKSILSKTKQSSLKRLESSNSVTSTSMGSVIQNFVMSPNSFDIILYVDNNETSGSSNSQNDEILINLTKHGIKHEVKDLKVGDFLWICRDRISKKELVLPYIVERKRMDDFAHSIKDKRYHEQKFRLKKSGIENLIYLVESHGKNQHTGLPLQTLYQAASNTAIQENFFVKFTENTKETVEYLANFSRVLVKMFKLKTLASCSKDDIQQVGMSDDLISLMTFKELNESSVKNKRMKVTELFVKMLIQIKGMSVERALAITQTYPTPILLKKMYEENPGSKGEKLLSGIKYGKYGKSIGIVLSKTVYQAFNNAQY